MALIGNITNRGYIQGHINEANGILTGVITNSGQLGGQVVGLRGLKGDKGDTGDTGATGNGIASVSKTGSSGNIDTYTITYTNGGTVTFTVTNGIDGHSPIITASKVDKTTTIYADGEPLGTIIDGADGVDGVDGIDGTDGVGISSITKTSTSGLVDTYTITFTDTNTTTFDVTNGQDGIDGIDGIDGFSPIANVAKVGDTATITITDEDGTTTATITDGQDGIDGIDGVDGHSPSVTASKAGKVTTVYVDGSSIATINDGNDGQDGQDGTDGQDGYSPSASVTKSGSVATISITDKNGTTTASVSDGSGVPSGGTSGQVLTKHSATNYDVEWADVDGAYIVTFTYDDIEEEYSCDKTAQEIYEANQAGKTVVGIEYNYYEEDPPNPSEYHYDCYPLSYCIKTGEEYSATFKSLHFQSQWYGGDISRTEFLVDGTNITLVSDYLSFVPISRTINNKTLQRDITLTASDVGAQETLVSGTNIKTINNNSILGSGDLNISIPTITDTYSGTSSDGMSGKAVKSAIDALDGTITGSAGAGKTLTAFSQTDGKVSATFSDISITKSQVSDFPTIPTVNDATLTIQKNGTTVNTFTANASSNVTANITVPTQASDIGAQPTLVSGTNIKTVNSNSLLGSGDVAITLSNLGVHISTSDPTSADGNNGDIWIKYEVSV